MTDEGVALTTSEVARLARMAIGALDTIAWPINVPAGWRASVDRARGHLDELLLLCGFTESVAAGLAVVVEQAEPEPAIADDAGALLPASECEPFTHGSLCRRDECLCPCHTIPPHLPAHRR